MIKVTFTAKQGFSTQQYQQVMQALADAGLSKPAQRLSHIAWGSEADIHVTDVWTSAEALQQFGTQLTPILQRVGVELEPDIAPAHYLVQ